MLVLFTPSINKKRTNPIVNPFLIFLLIFLILPPHTCCSEKNPFAHAVLPAEADGGNRDFIAKTVYYGDADAARTAAAASTSWPAPVCP